MRSRIYLWRNKTINFSLKIPMKLYSYNLKYYEELQKSIRYNYEKFFSLTIVFSNISLAVGAVMSFCLTAVAAVRDAAAAEKPTEKY